MVRTVLPIVALLLPVAVATRGLTIHKRKLSQLDMLSASFYGGNPSRTPPPKFAPVETPTYGVAPPPVADTNPTYFASHPKSGKERDKFEKECYSYLLAKHVVNDELISQHDFAAFLTEYCQWERVCAKNEKLEFGMLPSPIQLAFVDPLCGSRSATVMCLVESDQDFGYVYNSSTIDATETQIAAICESLYPLVGEYVESTPAPSAPRPKKTYAPYHKDDSPVYSPAYPVYEPLTPPTKAPKSFPPVLSPSVNYTPEMSPVVEPTPETVPSATTAPTEAAPSPTCTPTAINAKTYSPTTSPTRTHNPTNSATAAATSSPTATGPETDFPSGVPSDMPSITPARAFINELGYVNETGFVEVAYSTFLGQDIVNYTYDLYSGDGLLLTSANLAEGNVTVDGLTLTYAFFPNTEEVVKAVTLVDPEQTVLFFLSLGAMVTAIDGPAKGWNSTSIEDQIAANSEIGKEYFNETVIRRRLEGGSNITYSSFGLVGSGCDFEEFLFAEIPATPGYVNLGQIFMDCNGTAVPSAAPSFELGGPDGISVGSTVAIAVSTCLLIIALLYQLRGTPDEKKGSANNPDTKDVLEEQPLVGQQSDPDAQAKPKPRKKMIIELNEELMSREQEHVNRHLPLATGDVIMADTGDDIDVEEALQNDANLNIEAAQSVAPSVTPSVAVSVGTGTMPEPTAQPDDAQSVTPSIAVSIGTGTMPVSDHAQRVQTSAAVSKGTGNIADDVQSVTSSIAVSICTGVMPEPDDTQSVAVSVGVGNMPAMKPQPDDGHSVASSVAISIGTGTIPEGTGEGK